MTCDITLTRNGIFFNLFSIIRNGILLEYVNELRLYYTITKHIVVVRTKPKDSSNATKNKNYVITVNKLREEEKETHNLCLYTKNAVKLFGRIITRLWNLFSVE